MKKMKKLFAMLLALAMVLGMSMTAFAEVTRQDATGTETDKGTITIKGLGNDKATDQDKMTISAYPIVTAKYEGDNGVFSGYEEKYKGELGLEENEYLNLDQLAPGATLTVDEAYLNAVKSYIDSNSVIPARSEEISEKVTEYTFSNMAVGTYLILITGAEGNVYSPVVASVYYAAKTENPDGSGPTIGNEFVSGEVDLIGTNQWVKKSDNPTIDKKIEDSNGTDHSNSVNIGDDVPYVVSVKPIPYYGGDYPVFNITDTLDKGLTYNEDMAVTIYDGETAVKTFATTGEGKELDVAVVKDETTGKTTISLDFAPQYQYMLNEYQGMELRLTYSAKLNENATMNQVANVNNVKLEYTHDSKVNSDDVKDEEEDETYSYTFDIDAAVEGSVTNQIVTKIGEEITEEHGNALAGAVFGLYTDADCKTMYSNGQFTGEVESDADGQLKIWGLGASEKDGGTTYYLKEIKAPEGYSLNTNVYEIKIVPEYDTNYADRISKWTITVSTGGTVLGTNVFTVIYETDADGKITGAKVALNATGSEDNIVFDNGTVTNVQKDVVDEAEIANTKLSSLPSTGGIGTTIFTVAGCLIMIVAAGLFFASRRKSAAK
ncbi:MAG: isopeptide-forming domain-containing fimbrial protein [Lachnospiraceae bacterium]|nr:isopeptide-forming domain-containing fimbrial protein [Lachnospiraceae bacterium]